MADENKVLYIQTTQHALVSESAGNSATLGPNDKVLYNEDADSHKQIRKLIEAGDPSVEHLSLVEIDPKAEKERQEEEKEMLEKAAKIAAEARNEQAQAAQEQLDKQQEAEEQRLEDGAPSAIEGTDFPPQDEEAQRLAEQSGPGQRASTQEDVVEEESGSKSGRRSKRS
jgi:transcriptional regulator with GAF, ATPase, and Fis domain